MTASPHVVGGELRPVNPATLEPVGSVRVNRPEEVGEAVAEARLAQETWARESLEARSRLLREAAHIVLADLEKIAATIVAETGKPVIEAMTTELFVSLDNLVWLSRNLGRVLGPERVPFLQPYVLHKRARLLYEPMGVVGIISPWNFPFGVPFTQVATAVAAGNAAVLKPSELTPLSGAWVEDVFRRAGMPAGLVRVIQGPGDIVGDALVRARGVAKLVFTGSTDVGRVVGARAAERLCPATLELGGKDPMLVLDDADLERAIEGALWGSFANCGQVCSGIERIYVARSLYEPFVEGLAERARSLRLGRGDDPRTDMGPLVSEEQRARVEELVADAVDRGATVVTGGARPDVGLPGWFHEPTVLAAAAGAHAGRIDREEIFGPVVTVASIDNEEDGIRLANDSPFGLGASVWTRSRERAGSVAARLEAGSVWMNDAMYSYGTCQAPWGGPKGSGYGRTHSRHGLYELSQIKFTDVDRGRLTPPWWYPYGEGVLDGFQGALGALYGDGPGARLGSAWRHRHGLVVLGRRVLRGR